MKNVLYMDHIAIVYTMKKGEYIEYVEEKNEDEEEKKEVEKINEYVGSEDKGQSSSKSSSQSRE